ncbi:translation initiation factor eIF 4e-like domain-containing protein [Phakopsora pachyrhizi]|nr:translation initiation factor eIF 4e-like domain-containing protein [Phakopsora pachyrhizi]
MTVDKNNRSFPPLKLANPTTQSTLSKVKINSPISRTPTTNSSSNTSTTLPISSSSSTATARKLGSFNSLAVSNSKPYQALNAPLVSPNSASNLTVQDVNESLKDDLRDSNALRTSLAGSIGQQHRLRFKWVFWVLHRAPSKKMSEEEFGRAMRRIGSCDTVETFYSLYLHIKRPSNQTPISDLHLFADPIKPVWEDENNVKGGKWTIKLRKGLSDRLWESLMMSLVGGGLERLIGSNGLNEICGVVLSVRKDEDILAVWHRTGHSELGGDGKMAKQVKLSRFILFIPSKKKKKFKE